MNFLRVKDWNKHFENNRTRELLSLNWVPIPNKMDGDGYTQLLDHPDGMNHFAAWVLIVEVASKCTPRGYLLRGSICTPYDAQSLARVTRGSALIFDAAIPRLIDIGWLEWVELTSEIASKCEIPAPVCIEGNGREGREWNGKLLAELASEIYDCYPRKVGKPEALRSISKALRKTEFQILKSKTVAFANAVIGQDQQFIPHPSTWFNQERFNDDPSTWDKSGNGKPPSLFELRAVLSAKESEAQELRNRHCNDSGAYETWDSSEAKSKHSKLKVEIRDITRKIGAFKV